MLRRIGPRRARDLYDESRFDLTRTLYERLGLPTGAKGTKLREAYLKKAQELHPDKRPETEEVEATKEFKALHEAYSTLTHPGKRRLYDMELRFRSVLADGEAKLQQEDAEWHRRLNRWLRVATVLSIPVIGVVFLAWNPQLRSRLFYALPHEEQVRMRRTTEGWNRFVDLFSRKEY
eukprot:GEMP01116857.1.p1 GENE.GEMP01116857.1~~GEMP01116857.1.p1  ORF type:complete len:177 (+),score=28.72 GEMP01116857.1:28-558(+)